MTAERNPWLALYALVIGFFMILLDMTVVAVANPAIMSDLHTDITKVIWVTSAYLLSYAVPLLVTGRLGDRFGPKNIYLVGLAVFTLASLGCGLSGSIGMLIAARAAQGLGAAMMTPQTMAVITRTFPADKRGAAMGLWGGVAGLATLVGPILGGVLVDRLGWEWIFYINIPVGIVAFAAAVRLVPQLSTHEHKFDILGVVISGVGMTLLVFGLQEGNSHSWSAWVWLCIIAGLAIIAGFVVHQSRVETDPLVPLSLFRDRNFALSTVAISAMGAAITALMLPMFFYLQAVQEMSPTESGLMLAPMALVTGFFAPVVGKLGDRLPPWLLPTVSFALLSGSLVWLAVLLAPGTSVLLLQAPLVLMGVTNAGIWAPLAATATRNLPMHQAGAGAGVYNTTRQVGSVLGSAAIGALIAARMSAHGLHGSVSEGGGNTTLPEFLRAEFSSALGESLYLPAAILLLGVLAAALFTRSRPTGTALIPEPAGKRHS